MGVTGFWLILYSLNDEMRRVDRRIIQVKRLFMCNGFAKIATGYDLAIKKGLSYCYEEKFNYRKSLIKNLPLLQAFQKIGSFIIHFSAHHLTI